MGAGAFAGVFATVLTHPMDVVRAKLTVQSQAHKTYNGTRVPLCLAVVGSLCFSLCIYTMADDFHGTRGKYILHMFVNNFH